MLKTLATSVLWIVAMLSINVAQAKLGDIRVAQTTPSNCETNASDLNTVAKEELSQEGIVIAIARLGNRETSRIRNHERLLAVELGLVKSGLPAKRIVVAEGERVKGYGRVEIYTAGKLRMVLLANYNKGLCVECCDASAGDLQRARNKTRR